MALSKHGGYANMIQNCKLKNGEGGDQLHDNCSKLKSVVNWWCYLLVANSMPDMGINMSKQSWSKPQSKPVKDGGNSPDQK
jgi:hypothetical protein